MKNKITILVILVTIYFVLKYIIPYGEYILYPINLLVTFMHEFGHALFAIITGGSVDGVRVNSDGSGLAITRGGWEIIILMGGYIGSAIFGNILLRIGLSSEKDIAGKALYVLAGMMILISLIWFSSIVSSIILMILGGIVITLAKYTNYDAVILQFLGVASILFIIEDFNVGPASDLSKFSEIFIIVPQFIWMIVWLVIVLIITGLNIKAIVKK